MALLVMADNSKQKIPHDKAQHIWDVLNGFKKPENEAQVIFCDNVRKVYLDWHKASDAYIQDNLMRLLPFITAEWRVDSSGNAVKPDDGWGWEFAKKWGLWENRGKGRILTEKQVGMV